MINLTMDDNKWSSIFPSGLYRYDCVFYNPKTKLFSANFTLEVKSEIRTSF